MCDRFEAKKTLLESTNTAISRHTETVLSGAIAVFAATQVREILGLDMWKLLVGALAYLILNQLLKIVFYRQYWHVVAHLPELDPLCISSFVFLIE